MNEIPQTPRGYYAPEACSLGDFARLVLQDVDSAQVPLASATPKNVPLYDMPRLATLLDDAANRQRLMAEWARVLQHGAGVFVLRSAYTDTTAIDAATRIFNQTIAREKAEKGAGADHFATAGSNDRIWNSLQKLCEADPEVFVAYHGNAAIDAVCEAWLGPNYQMTAQVNLVHPGGQARQAHRDYHLGFQTAETSARYPAHVHDLSPLMTLQGGIAHGDTPLESGPTKLLPFSQLYRPGYAAWRRDDFRAFFEENHVQVPLQKGDALFFNPALFHAAGANTSADIHRMVNLLQVSSAFGRAMETVDRAKMSRLVFEPLKARIADGTQTAARIDAAIAATAEGYSFPTNLDSDPPVGGLAPQSQAALLKEAVHAGWTQDAFDAALSAQEQRKRA
jgi:ectoine hydroxylase-related dioxygenase (phytanoyl-CoA dioxygenase family)